MTDIKSSFLSQLDAVLQKYELVRDEADRREAKYENVSNFFVSALAAIDRIAGYESTYAKSAREYVKNGPTSNAATSVKLLAGVISALHEDVTGDFLSTAKELIHAAIFNDFLEMADYLLKEEYKDAAAVIAGGVLETHLHQLCVKEGLELELPNGTSKKTDRLNNDLAGKNIYNKLFQKKITAWLDLRNKAAHAQYNEYTHQDVSELVNGIRDFISRYPA